MHDGPSTPDASSKRPLLLWHPRRWPIWEMPSHLLVSIFVVEAAMAAIAVIVVLRATIPTPHEYIEAATIAGLALFTTELGKQIERRRLRLTVPHHIEFSGVWTFCAALALPLVLTIPVVALIQFHLWWRTGRPRVAYYRSAFTMTTVLLACVAAATVQEALSPELPPSNVLSIAVALLVYTTVNTGLVSGAIAMSSPQPSLAVALGSWEDHLMELSTLSLGAMAATALNIHPALCLLVLVPMVVLHRSAPLRQLRAAAETDSKTGLLNAATWATRAMLALKNSQIAGHAAGMLVIDVDYFKRINDTYGHLVGDQVLQAMADALRLQTRDGDVIGRFGGEEFVVLLPNLHGEAEELRAAAERIREFVAHRQITVNTADGPLTVGPLTVSIGGSITTAIIDDQAGFDTLLRAADDALYVAKANGRNQVRIAGETDDRSNVSVPAIT
jgi:diguanylate cyclase (GGDEF)-like protein